jgi:hypothetical protein
MGTLPSQIDSKLKVNWKTDPNTPWGDTDTPVAAIGDMMMTDVGSAETVVITFPEAVAGTAGQRIVVVNMNNKPAAPNGTVTISPNANDAIGPSAVGADVNFEVNKNGMVFRSDGQNAWWPVASADGDATDE